MQWTYAAIYAAIAVLLGSAILGASHLISPYAPNATKNQTYECGMEIQSDARERFSVRFYLVAIMFILFDIETVFMIPWAVLYKQLGVAGLAEVGLFFAILSSGLVYLWKRGGLEWD